MKVKTLWRSAVLGLTGIGLVGLFTAAAWAQDLHKVRVTVGQRGLWDTTLAFVTGEKQGFFTKEGIKLDIFFTRGGSETLQPVAAGTAEFGWGNGTLGVLGAYQKGGKIKIVSDEYTGVDMFWYVKGDSPYKNFKDLAGKKVGFSSHGSSTNIVLLRMAEIAGIKVDAVAAGGIPDNYTAVMTGQIAAGWSVPPQHIQDVKDGKIRIISRAEDFPELNGITFRVNIGNSDYLKKNPAVARAFFRAYQNALDYNYSHMEEVLPEFAKMNKVPVDIAKESMKFYPPKSVALAPLQGMEFQNQQAVVFRFLDKPLTKAQIDNLVDLSYLPKKK